MSTTLLLLLITFVSMFVQTVIGFGYGFIAVPLYSFLLSSSEITAISTVVATGAILILSGLTIKKTNLKILLYILPPCLIGTYVGISIGKALPEATLKRYLGLVLVFMAIYQLSISKRIKVKANLPFAILLGFISGILQGSVVMGGAPIALYLLVCTDDKDEYYGTMNCNFIIVNIFMIIIRILNGQLNSGSTSLILLMMIPTVLAIYIGRKLLKKISVESMKNVVYGFMILMGSYIVIFS